MNATPSRIVFVGVATQDAIAVVERYPGADERVVADDVLFAGGGPAATAAVAAARLGIAVALVAAVGDDEAGRKVIHDLHGEGVDVSGIAVVPGARTALSLVVISGPEKARAISNLPGPALRLDENPVGLGMIKSADWVHVDQHGWAEVHRHTDATALTGRLSVDAGNAIPGYCQAGTALYVPTRSALVARYGRPGDEGLEPLMRRAIADGAATVVVTSGAAGSCAMAHDGPLLHSAIPPGPIRSTLGAGDVFHGALLAGLVRLEEGTMTGGLREALEYATVVASLSCRGVDGRSQIPRHDEAIAVTASLTHAK